MSIEDAEGDQEHEYAIDREWHTLQTRYRAIYDQGFARYAAEIPLTNAFTIDNRHVRCIDEGTPGGIHLGGSGILLSNEEAARVLTTMKADALTSHAGCGAAALAASQRDIPASEAEHYAQEWAQKMAQKVGIPYAGHIEAQSMHRPTAFHNAIVAYYDNTGRFDYSQVEGLPPGFMISRRIIPGNIAQSEAALAAQIAFGSHGLGSRFTADTPFLLVHVVDPRARDESATKELESVKAQHGDRVRIQELVMPA